MLRSRLAIVVLAGLALVSRVPCQASSDEANVSLELPVRRDFDGKKVVLRVESREFPSSDCQGRGCARYRAALYLDAGDDPKTKPAWAAPWDEDYHWTIRDIFLVALHLRLLHLQASFADTSFDKVLVVERGKAREDLSSAFNYSPGTGATGYFGIARKKGRIVVESSVSGLERPGVPPQESRNGCVKDKPIPSVRFVFDRKTAEFSEPEFFCAAVSR